MRFTVAGGGTLDQLYTLHRVLEGLWEFAQPVHMCFVDLEKAFDRVPRGILWGSAPLYGVRGPLLRAVRSLYRPEQELGSHCRHGWDENQHLQILRPWFSTGKGWHVPSPRVGGEVLPQVEEFKYLGVLFTSEGKMRA
ncbi:hypothetical protein L3Q82_020252 [Scortum barcoo]|uniref:Uncharacterized protein n=1 Tax=Scortum barcoo TaxID=214431 RepID=A0ACB8V8R6_9TELE|nr:hypothetical protein L3Q82_020252 [Scortum barcoo]